MKRILLFIIIMMAFALPVHSAEYEYLYGDETVLYPEAEMDSLISSLPEDVREEIDDFISAENDKERAEALTDKLDLGFWIRHILSLITELFAPCLAETGRLLVIILLSKILFGITSLGNGELNGMYSLSVSLICSVAVAGIAVDTVNIAASYISKICSVVTAMLPVMEAVMLSSGNVTGAALNGTSLMIYITVTENFTVLVLIPLAGALLALSCSSKVFDSVNISSLISGLRRLLTTILSFFLLIFSFVLGIQSSLAASADSLALKTVRFALGSYVPIVGGAVSEALSTVHAGFDLIRRTAGGIAVVIILFIVLPPLLSIFFTRLSLCFCKTVAELLECNDVSRIITDADSVLSVFCALAVMSSVFFIFAITLFMNSGLT